MKISAFIVFLFLSQSVAFSSTVYVPDDYPTIQSAINNPLYYDTIIVRPGIYVENIDFIGMEVTVKSEQGAAVTTIDGSQNGSVVTFKSGEWLKSAIDGFTITNGTGTFDGVYQYNGGGIYLYQSSPAITNCIVENNTADMGGGIYCEFSSPNLTGNTLSENTGLEKGGGLYCVDYSSPMIMDNLIIGNLSDMDAGGGICCVFDSHPTIIRNIIRNNSSDFPGGGGIYCYRSSPTITDNVIIDNSSTDSGGGILCSYSSAIILNNFIRGNNAGFGWAISKGGGIHCGSGSSIIIDGNTISDNFSCRGGGIGCHGSTLTISNNLVTGNVAESSINGGKGGGIYIDSESLATITGCTVSDNISQGTSNSKGGGIYCAISSSSEVTNSILWNNTCVSGSEIWLGYTPYPSTLTISYSDIDGGASSCYWETGCTFNWGPGLINADPGFANSMDADYHLTWSSPCLNAGENSSIIGTGDVEEDPRIAAGRVDMGADEYFYHFYYTGSVIPGANINLKVVGYPSAPVVLYSSSGIHDPPYWTPYGDIWINWPPGWQWGIGSVPGDGVLVVSAKVPINWTPGSEHYLQSLIGPWGGPYTRLSNLLTLTVE